MARVLVVDDDTAALEIRKRILERRGHEVVAAADPASARQHFAEAQPETVVLDLRLPDPSDGLSLIREFRAASQQVRIVVLCGLAADLKRSPERCLVDAILEKPIRSEQLLAAILTSDS